MTKYRIEFDNTDIDQERMRALAESVDQPTSMLEGVDMVTGVVTLFTRDISNIDEAMSTVRGITQMGMALLNAESVRTFVVVDQPLVDFDYLGKPSPIVDAEVKM